MQCLQRRGQVQRQRAPVPAAAVVVDGPCRGGAGALPGGRVAGRGAVVGAERGGQVVQAERLGELRVEQGKPGNLARIVSRVRVFYVWAFKMCHYV